MKKQILLIMGVVFVAIFLLVWLNLRDSGDFYRIDSASVKEVIALEDRVLYHTNDNLLKRYNFEEEKGETLAVIDTHNLQFSPDGQYISYTLGESIYIDDLASMETTARLPGVIHSWQTETELAYIESMDGSESTFFGTGTLKLHDTETQTATTIGNTSATKLYAISETEGVIHQAFGEGGETRGKILRYDATSNKITDTTSVIDIVNTSSAPGVFAFMKEGNNMSIVKEDGVKEISPPATQSQYHILSIDTLMGEQVLDGSNTVYTYDLNSGDKQLLFKVSEIGRPKQVSAYEKHMAVVTQQGLYLGRF